MVAISPEMRLFEELTPEEVASGVPGSRIETFKKEGQRWALTTVWMGKTGCRIEYWITNPQLVLKLPNGTLTAVTMTDTAIILGEKRMKFISLVKSTEEEGFIEAQASQAFRLTVGFRRYNMQVLSPTHDEEVQGALRFIREKTLARNCQTQPS